MKHSRKRYLDKSKNKFEIKDLIKGVSSISDLTLLHVLTLK